MLLKPKKLVFSAALIVCILLRVYLKLSAIDPATGFYTGNLAVSSIFNWITAIACIGLLLMGWFSSNKSHSPRLHKDFGVRVFSVLTGISTFVFIGSTFQKQVDDLLTLTYGSSMISSLLLSAVGIFCLIVAPVVSGFLFLTVGIKGCSKHYHGALFLFPILWQTALLLSTFMSYTLMRSVSDQLLMIVSLLFIIPFLLANGRILSGTNAEKGAHQLSMFGLPFALVAVPSSIGILSSAVSGKTVMIGPSVFAAVFYLCIGLYAIAMVFSRKEK